MLEMNKYRGCDTAVVLLLLCLVWLGRSDGFGSGGFGSGGFGSGGFGSGGYAHHGVVAATAATRDGAWASSAQNTGRTLRRRRTAAVAFDTMLLNTSTVDVTNSSSSNAGAVQKPTSSQVWSSLPTFSSKANNTSSTTASSSREKPASNHPHIDFDHRHGNSTNKQHDAPSGGKDSTRWNWTLVEDGLELMIFAIALLVTFITAMSAQMLWDSCYGHDLEEEFDDDAMTTCTTASTCSSSRHSFDVLEPEPPNK